jgi:hypothetical protein
MFNEHNWRHLDIIRSARRGGCSAARAAGRREIRADFPARNARGNR